MEKLASASQICCFHERKERDSEARILFMMGGSLNYLCRRLESPLLNLVRVKKYDDDREVF